MAPKSIEWVVPHQVCYEQPFNDPCSLSEVPTIGSVQWQPSLLKEDWAR